MSSGRRNLLIRSLRQPKDALATARLNLRLRVRGCQVSGLAVCDGRQPILFTRGPVRLGTGVIFRSVATRCEVGATATGELTVGAGTIINEGVSVVAHHRVSIGRACLVAGYVSIFDTNHHAIESDAETVVKPVTIGDNVWLGRNVIVLPGVTIGENSVVAAGSVITRDIPASTLVGGNPAKVIRPLAIRPGWVRQQTAFFDAEG